jgi:hypothetical protein
MGEWILDTLVALGAWGVLLLNLLETVFPPMPSELVMPMAGYLVAGDEMTMTGVNVAGTAGSVRWSCCTRGDSRATRAAQLPGPVRIHRGFGSGTGSAHTLESTMRWR